MVTIERVEERLEHLRRLELMGVPMPEQDLGPAMVLWTEDRAGNERWEILPQWIAELAIGAIPSEVARAVLYERPPALAPLPVVAEWVRQRLERKEVSE